MTSTRPLPDRLEQLGEALHAATASDLARRAAPADAPAAPAAARRGGGRRRAALLALAVGVVALPGGAIAANALLSEEDVARSMPAGTLALMGTDPTCTVVEEGVEFDCTLARAPRGEIAPGDWAGTVEPTVGPDQRVNGGCRSLNPAGTRWRCYVGREAVRQRIVGAQLLGERVSGPGVG